MGALMWSTKSSAQGNKNKHKHLHDEGKFWEVHHATDHDMGNYKVLKAHAQKLEANWELHWSNCGHNYKKKHNN